MRARTLPWDGGGGVGLKAALPRLVPPNGASAGRVPPLQGAGEELGGDAAASFGFSPLAGPLPSPQILHERLTALSRRSPALTPFPVHPCGDPRLAFRFGTALPEFYLFP